MQNTLFVNGGLLGEDFSPGGAETKVEKLIIPSIWPNQGAYPPS